MDQGVIEIAFTDLSAAILREDSKQLRPFRCGSSREINGVVTWLAVLVPVIAISLSPKERRR